MPSRKYRLSPFPPVALGREMVGRYRHILSTGFDRDGEGWLYYRNAWSGGVPVSSGERELFLAGRLLKFRRLVSGRAAVTRPRPYWPMLRRMITAFVLGYDPGEIR